MNDAAAPAGDAGGADRPDERPSKRAAGALLHVSSLPSPFPIGDLGQAAHDFLDWLVEAGLNLWQTLPVGPTGYGDSPYGAHSAFAGNPLFVSPERLVGDGLLEERDAASERSANLGSADFTAARAGKERLQRRAWERFGAVTGSGAAEAQAWSELSLQWNLFREDAATRTWLDDWTLFAVLKEKHAGRSWLEWEAGLRDRKPPALDRARRELAAELEYRAFEQFLFHRQWSSLHEAARAKGIRLIGDLPFYPALDSADVWAHRDLFELARSGKPKAVAGVPPDYFSETGQLWGNPVYRWERLAESGFSWWIDRLRWQLGRFDLVRLDHFRGFVAWWRVPGRAATAAKGRGVPGPGRALFDAARDALGDLPLLAEDLGDVDEPVETLRHELDLPGMRVLQFGFLERDSSHAPHRHTPDSVAYTGTHDNDTCRGWLAGAPQEARERALAYLGCSVEGFPEAMVRAAFASPAELAIVPLQDLCGLGSEARMNVPSRESGNWRWRIRPEQVPSELPARLRRLAAATARDPLR